jgi:peptidoglycan/LPS O-acetylase OafA/YrhL
MTAAQDAPRPAAAKVRWFAPRLDVIRFVAFALVFLGHNLGRAAFVPTGLRDNTGPGEIVGVVVFFVLSAYLIGRLLLIERETTATVSLRRYWPRRILRIWPLYFALVALAYVVPRLLSVGQPALIPSLSQLPFWLTFTANWGAPLVPLAPSYLSMFWTVCVEEQIYFLFPLILMLPRRAMVALLSAMVVAGPVACLLTVHSGAAYPAVWNLTSSHLDSFGIGLLLAVADSRLEVTGRVWQRARAAVASAPGIVTLTALTAAYFVVGGIAGPVFYEGYPTVVTYLAASVLAAGWIVVASGSEPLRWSGSRLLAWLGRRGYGLYAWHWPALLVVGQITVLNHEGDLTVPGFLVSLAVTIAAAILSYRVLEAPFLKLRMRYQVVRNRM